MGHPNTGPGGADPPGFYGMWWPGNLEITEAAASRVEAYLCPSDSYVRLSRGDDPVAGHLRYFWGFGAFDMEYHTTHYKSVLGSKWEPRGVTLPAHPSAGGRHSAYQGGDHGIDLGNGAFPSGRRYENPVYAALWQFTYLSAVSGGLSNTFGFGEVSGYWNGTAWVDPQIIGATMGIRFNEYKRWLDNRVGFCENWQSSFGFSSMHAGGGNFAVLDGAVRFVSETVSDDIYRAAGTIDCGESVSLL
jgi:hypothetical protein